MTKEEILVHVDHTLLKAVSAWDEIQTLCEEAIENHTASVCIPPSYVKRVSKAYGDMYARSSDFRWDIIPRRQRFTKPRRLWLTEPGKWIWW